MRFQKEIRLPLASLGLHETTIEIAGVNHVGYRLIVTGPADEEVEVVARLAANPCLNYSLGRLLDDEGCVDSLNDGP
jgi:hypothetical protein